MEQNYLREWALEAIDKELKDGAYFCQLNRQKRNANSKKGDHAEFVIFLPDDVLERIPNLAKLLPKLMKSIKTSLPKAKV